MERCCVFKQDEENIHFNYEVLKKYPWEDLFYNESLRELVRCKECGAFFIHQATAINNSYSARFIQVEDEKRADYINETTNAITFDAIEEPCVCKYKGDWYFLNLEPKKELSREEQIEEINKMTLEEKIKEWKHLYKNLSDFDVHGYSTDGIDCVLMVIKDILELSELTGGMIEPYKSDYEKLIEDYNELYKVREEEEKREIERMRKDFDELFGDKKSEENNENEEEKEQEKEQEFDEDLMAALDRKFNELFGDAKNKED